MLPVFADASNNNTQALVTCMLCQKKLNTCINKILIYIRKWFLPFISSQTISKHHNYQATMCVLYLQWCHLFSVVGRIWQGEINKFTESLNVSSKRLKKQYFIMNSLKTSKTHTLSTFGQFWNLARLNDVRSSSMLSAKIGKWRKQVTARYE